MKAIDTNIVARYVIGDDPDQARRATAVLAHPCYISDTVLLEAAWLFSSRYRMDRATLAATMTDLMLLPTVTVENPDGMRWAIERFVAGGDLADMIHIVAARHVDAFVSFESRLADRAGSETPVPIEQPA